MAPFSLAAYCILLDTIAQNRQRLHHQSYGEFGNSSVNKSSFIPARNEWGDSRLWSFITSAVVSLADRCMLLTLVVSSCRSNAIGGFPLVHTPYQATPSWQIFAHANSADFLNCRSVQDVQDVVGSTHWGPSVTESDQAVDLASGGASRVPACRLRPSTTLGTRTKWRETSRSERAMDVQE